MLPGDSVFIKRLFVLLFGLALGYHFRQGWADRTDINQARTGVQTSNPYLARLKFFQADFLHRGVCRLQGRDL